MRFPAFLLVMSALVSAPAAFAQQERAVVDASKPNDLSVTIYRDPDRSPDDSMNRNFPGGFAMISEVRTVTLPAGRSTIRFEGVAEGMVGVTAIVTGLPGGTIEKNRNAELLSPAALVNGMLGNRVTITRTNPATGQPVSEQATVRTRADGGVVLQTSQGFEAVRCSGLPEKLSFNRVPDGLSALPIYSVDTFSESGGTYEVTLTYIASGFDWQANYVANLGEKGNDDDFTMQMLSWLTLLNDNGQSFNNAKLQIVAGQLNIDSNFRRMAAPPVAEPLRLECYPIGSTKTGSPIQDLVPPPPPPPPMAPPPAPMMRDNMIVVTGARREEALMDVPLAVSVVTAEEEDLGDLKLFRVPDRVDVSAKGQKQVAFINEDDVTARYRYITGCQPNDPDEAGEDMEPAGMLLVTKNEEEKGLGIALPQGSMTIYEPTSIGLQLAGKTNLRDFARGQDVELELGQSAQVHAHCSALAEKNYQRNIEKDKWVNMFAVLSNANPHPIKVRVQLGWSSQWDVRFPRQDVVVKNGYKTVELTIPPNTQEDFRWKIRRSERD